MAAPVLPSEFRALIPTSEDDICTVLVKFAKFGVLLYRLVKYRFDDAGALTATFKADVCARLQELGGCPVLPKCNAPDSVPVNACAPTNP